MVERPTNHSKALVLAAFAAVYIIWGSTYLAILLAIKSIPPFLMSACRFCVAGLLLLVWALIKGETLPGRKSILKISVAGILTLAFGNALVGWVEQYLPSGLAAILVATVPLWFILLDKRQWQFYFSNRNIIIGLVVGFAGVILLFAGKGAADVLSSKMKIISLFVMVVSTVAWTTGSLYSKYQKITASTLMKVAIQMVAASVVLFIVSFAFNEEEHFTISAVSGRSILALAYLIVMGSLVAYMAYTWLLSIRPPSLVGTYAYVNPVVAVFLGWLIADEHVDAQKMIGLAIIIAGLVIVNMSKDKKVVRPDSSNKLTSPRNDQNYSLQEKESSG
jgi:drug/metabolite transporter (DMT)-like permease